MDEDVVIAPNEINNGENHTARGFLTSSSVRNNAGSSSEDRSRRNDMNHIGNSGISSSDSRIKSSGSSKANSTRSHGFPPRVTLSADFLEPGAGPSKEAKVDNREIRFVVHFNGDTLPMSLAECETVDTLKTLVQARFEIPPCQQIISGWPTNEPSSNSTRFGSLELPDEVNLHLTTASSNLAGLNILR